MYLTIIKTMRETKIKMMMKNVDVGCFAYSNMYTNIDIHIHPQCKIDNVLAERAESNI